MTQAASGARWQPRLRTLLAPLRRTPLHPQWLLGGRSAMSRWLQAEARGRVLDVGCGDRWAEKALLPDAAYCSLDSWHTGKDWYGANPTVFGSALRRGHPALVWAPLLFVLIPLVKLLAWLGDRLLPGWPAMTSGYQLVAVKP